MTIIKSWQNFIFTTQQWMPEKVRTSYNQRTTMRSATWKQFIFTPKLDDRYGVGKVASRIGLDREAEIFEGEDDLYVWTAHEHQREKLSCVLVDEAQFLSPKQVLQLTLIVDKLKIPVLCYGLRTDFRGEPFPGSVYLMAWADELVELKTICKSGKKATFNARLDEDGNRVTEGDQVSIGLNYEAQARDIFELDKVSPIDYKIPEAN